MLTSRRLQRRLLLAVLAPALLLAAAAADASTLTLAVGPDPAEDRDVLVTASGLSTGLGELVYAKLKPSPGATCASTYAADSGDKIIFGSGVIGPFSLQSPQTFALPGSYLLCGWVARSAAATASARASREFTVRGAQAAVAISAPASSPPGRRAGIVVRGSTELARLLTVTVSADRASCAAFSSADLGRAVISDQPLAPGPFELALTTPPFTGGAQVLCAYVQEAADDDKPEAIGTARVAVPKGTPTLSGQAIPSRDLTPPFRFTLAGRLGLPSGLPASACAGPVRVELRRTGLRLTRRTVIRKDCTYRATVAVPRGVRGRLRLTARFSGGALLAPRSSPSVFVRAG